MSLHPGRCRIITGLELFTQLLELSLRREVVHVVIISIMFFSRYLNDVITPICGSDVTCIRLCDSRAKTRTARSAVMQDHK